MKKIFALALAVVMLMAVCVPAFAAPTGTQITPNTANTGSTTITTTTQGTNIGEHGEYTVTIPADTTIKWGTLATDLTYTVSAQLKTDKVLKVTVAGTDTVMKNGALTLAYNLTGDTTYSTTANVVAKNIVSTFTVNIARDDWNNAVIADYSDTLTFTASVA